MPSSVRNFITEFKLLLTYLGIVGLVLLIGLTGVWLGIHGQTDEFAAWGGALGTAIAFGTLFARRDNGAAELERYLQKAAATSDPEEAARIRLAGVIRGAQLNSDGQARQTTTLSVASVTGTLFWGFGQKAAQILKCHSAFEVCFYLLPSLVYLLMSARILRSVVKQAREGAAQGTDLPATPT